MLPSELDQPYAGEQVDCKLDEIAWENSKGL